MFETASCHFFISFAHERTSKNYYTSKKAVKLLVLNFLPLFVTLLQLQKLLLMSLWPHMSILKLKASMSLFHFISCSLVTGISQYFCGLDFLKEEKKKSWLNFQHARGKFIFFLGLKYCLRPSCWLKELDIIISPKSLIYERIIRCLFNTVWRTSVVRIQQRKTTGSNAPKHTSEKKPAIHRKTFEKYITQTSTPFTFLTNDDAAVEIYAETSANCAIKIKQMIN